MASRFTIVDLKTVTDYLGFEAFCTALMSAVGFSDIEPLGGMRDGGRDAIHVSHANGKITIFVYSVERRWERKLFADLAKLKSNGHRCHRVVCVTTASVPTGKKDTVRKIVRRRWKLPLVIYDVHRVATLVDTRHRDLRDLHPNIFIISRTSSSISPSPPAAIDRVAYGGIVLRAHKAWLKTYTPLFAAHRDLEMFLVPASAGPHTAANRVRIDAVADRHTVTVILGESGAGKSTALWRIAAERASALARVAGDSVPVVIRLREWSDVTSCRMLAQEEFSSMHSVGERSGEELFSSGRVLFLIDGLNELPPVASLRDTARKDLQKFITSTAAIDSLSVAARVTTTHDYWISNT
jgi:hypothetical protein